MELCQNIDDLTSTIAKAKHSEISDVIYNISSESSDCVTLLLCFRPQTESSNVTQWGDSEERYELFTSSSSQLKKTKAKSSHQRFPLWQKLIKAIFLTFLF